jgi:hypothetical protein
MVLLYDGKPLSSLDVGIVDELEESLAKLLTYGL